MQQCLETLDLLIVLLTTAVNINSDKDMFITAYKESNDKAGDFIEAVKVEKDYRDSGLDDFFKIYRGKFLCS